MLTLYLFENLNFKLIWNKIEVYQTVKKQKFSTRKFEIQAKKCNFVRCCNWGCRTSNNFAWNQKKQIILKSSQVENLKLKPQNAICIFSCSDQNVKSAKLELTTKFSSMTLTKISSQIKNLKLKPQNAVS